MLVVAPLAVLVCYDIAKKNPRANILMIIIATAELYGGTLMITPSMSRRSRLGTKSAWQMGEILETNHKTTRMLCNIMLTNAIRR